MNPGSFRPGQDRYDDGDRSAGRSKPVGMVMMISLGAVLDACVLFDPALCDTLLRAAQRELYRPYWSERILEETRRALEQSRRVTEERARYRVNRMSLAFPNAAVPEYERILDAM